MVDTSGMTPVGELAARTDDEGRALNDLAQEAERYLASHKWCARVEEGHLDRGWEGILSVFHYRLSPADAGADSEVWVIVGDVPPAYMDCYYCGNGAQALEAYCLNMQDWVDRVRAGGTTDDLFPVARRHTHDRIPGTQEYADLLASRIEFIQTMILPDLAAELGHGGAA